MILIVKNSANERMLTLSEKTTIENAYYLFELNSVENQGLIKRFICSNTSPNPIRYDLVTITENNTEDPENGIISLFPGEYYYKVYEQASNTNLDPTGLNLIEDGILQVERESDQIAIFNPAETEIKTFNG